MTQTDGLVSLMRLGASEDDLIDAGFTRQAVGEAKNALLQEEIEKDPWAYLNDANRTITPKQKRAIEARAYDIARLHGGEHHASEVLDVVFRAATGEGVSWNITSEQADKILGLSYFQRPNSDRQTLEA